MASDSSNNFNRKAVSSYFFSYSVKSLCILYHDPTNKFPSKTPPSLHAKSSKLWNSSPILDKQFIALSPRHILQRACSLFVARTIHKILNCQNLLWYSNSHPHSRLQCSLKAETRKGYLCQESRYFSPMANYQSKLKDSQHVSKFEMESIKLFVSFHSCLTNEGRRTTTDQRSVHQVL